MRVWFINHYAQSPTGAGGTRHYSLARELVRQGHEVVIVASSFDHASRRERTLPPGVLGKQERVNGVTFVWLRSPSYAGNSAARLWNMLVFAWRVATGTGLESAPPPHVVVGSSPHLFAAWAAGYLARRHRVPFVLEVRDLWPQSLVDLAHFSSIHPLIVTLSWLERRLYRQAHKIITLLPGSEEHILARGGPRHKLVWLPNGVDLGLAPEPQTPQANHRFTLLYAGAHGLANGLDTVLDAAWLLQQEGWGGRVLFRLIGDGPEKPRLMQRAAAEGLRLVQFDQPVPKDMVYEQMQQADGFLMLLKDSPVFRFGVSPNKLFDYMASGRPIIFSVSTSHNPVERARAGLTIPPENPGALAAAVKELVAMPLPERIAMGQRGRAYVTEHHDLARLAGKLERLLRAQLGG